MMLRHQQLTFQVRKVRRNMIGRFRTINRKMSKLQRKWSDSALLHALLVPMVLRYAVRTLLMSLYDNDIDKLKQWNQADNNDVEKVKPKDLTTKFLYGENFNGDLTQFKDIDKEMAYTPLTGADLEKTAKANQRWWG